MKSAVHQYEDKLLEFAYGELPPHEADAVDAHVRGCTKCSEALSQISTVRKTMSRLPMEPAPDAGLESLLAYAEQHAKQAKQAPSRRASWWQRYLTPFVSVATLLTVGVIAYRASKDAPLDTAAPGIERKRDAQKKELGERPKTQGSDAPSIVTAQPQPVVAYEAQQPAAEPVAIDAPIDAPREAPKAKLAGTKIVDSASGDEVRGEGGQAANSATADKYGKADTAFADNKNLERKQALKAEAFTEPDQRDRREPSPKKKSYKSLADDFGSAEVDTEVAAKGSLSKRASTPSKPSAPSTKRALDEFGAGPVASTNADLGTRGARENERPLNDGTSVAQQEGSFRNGFGLSGAVPSGGAGAAAPVARAEAPVATPAPPPPSVAIAKEQKPQKPQSESYEKSAPSKAPRSLGLGSMSAAPSVAPDEDRLVEESEQRIDDAKANKDAEFKRATTQREIATDLSSATAAQKQGQPETVVKLALGVLSRGATGAQRADALRKLCDAYEALGATGQSQQYCDALIDEFPTMAIARQVMERRARSLEVDQFDRAEPERAKKAAPSKLAPTKK